MRPADRPPQRPDQPRTGPHPDGPRGHPEPRPQARNPGQAAQLPRGSGVTERGARPSPEPVRTPTAPAATQNPVPKPGTQDKPHSRRAAGRPRPESPRETPRAGIKPETRYRNWPVDRG